MSSPYNDFIHLGLGSPNITPLVDEYVFPYALISSISPSSGPGGGGTTVTVNGIGFAGVSKVKFGTAAATHVTIYSDSKLTAATPAASADTVNVQVTTPSGTISGPSFSYVPAITKINPNTGPLEGGVTVTVSGYALSSTYTFDFGSSPATAVSCSSEKQCTMVIPAHSPGKVSVIVKSPIGNSKSFNFTYLGPTITSFTPNSGPTTGGTSVVLDGTSLETGMTVNFGGANATDVNCFSSTSCTLTSPAHAAGTVYPTVTVNGIISPPAPVGFTYAVYPTLTSISPDSIPVNRSSTNVTYTLTFTGTGFSTASGQTFFNGSYNGQDIGWYGTCTSSTQCTATAVVSPATKYTADYTFPMYVTVNGLTGGGVEFTFPLTIPPPLP
jgi:hypothetical protein